MGTAPRSLEVVLSLSKDEETKNTKVADGRGAALTSDQRRVR